LNFHVASKKEQKKSKTIDGKGKKTLMLSLIHGVILSAGAMLIFSVFFQFGAGQAKTHLLQQYTSCGMIVKSG